MLNSFERNVLSASVTCSIPEQRDHWTSFDFHFGVLEVLFIQHLTLTLCCQKTCLRLIINLEGLCHRYQYMNGWYGNVYDKAPMLSISIQIARTKNMRLYWGQQCGTSNPVSCDIAPLTIRYYEVT